MGQHDYYPFGEEAGTSPDSEVMKFTGHERDFHGPPAETARHLDYMHARYYSSNLGRFLSVDSFSSISLQFGDKEDRAAFQRFLTRSMSWNRYSYVLNNPIEFRDPNGESAEAAALSVPWYFGKSTAGGAAAIGKSAAGGAAASGVGFGLTATGGLVIAAGAAGYGAGTLINEHVPGVSALTTTVFERLLDSTINLADNTRHRQDRVDGLIAVAAAHLGMLASSPGPEKDPDFNKHKGEIKAFLTQAARVAGRLPRKARDQVLSRIQEIANKAGVPIE